MPIFFYIFRFLLFAIFSCGLLKGDDQNLGDEVAGLQGGNTPKSFLSPKREPFAFDLGNVHGRAQVKFKPETFYLKRATRLRDNDLDNLYVSRHTIDFNFDFLYGKDFYGFDVSEFFLTFRNKGVWGNPESIAQTSVTNLKLLEATFGAHNHFITRHIIWIREIWFKFCINTAFDLNFNTKHYFTLGAFPFELGRGIALGNAFAVGPRILGFFSDNAIDQYAFGFKLGGDLYNEKLLYDIYGAILENKSDSMANTALKIRGQEFGRRLIQERGSGVVDFTLASRLRWFPIQEPDSKVSFEPYIMYNMAPEQRLEIDASANSKLGTIGLAGEFYFTSFEWGFDSALNFGRQVVHGIDRNQIEFSNDMGMVKVINSRIHNNAANGPKTNYVPNSDAQRIINTSAEDASQNGQPIGVANVPGVVGPVTLFNDVNRFRNPSVNKFKGWMAVADAAYKFGAKGKFRIAATAGVASGDENPNQDLLDPNSSNIDGDFKGFIPLQELYSGYRVRSVFLLGGTGKAPRLLSLPVSPEVIERLPSIESGFTNLIFGGVGTHYAGRYCERAININPNVLVYWKQRPSKAFDQATGMSSTKLASTYLGLEANALIDATLLDACRIYGVGSVFIPGGFYNDVKGTPLSREELRLIDRPDATGITNDRNPLLGNDIAFTLNFGIECRF